MIAEIKKMRSAPESSSLEKSSTYRMPLAAGPACAVAAGL
jgi:hypothetical protein